MNTSRLKKVPGIQGWLRAPQADKFVGELEREIAEAREALLGACGVSDDPRVREYLAKYKALDELVQFLKNTRKESVEEDD